MRKFIAIVVASLVPIGMWTAGCRQDTSKQAAFPNSAEMKGLAKADTSGDKNKPPRINPAPIDREIMNLPENATMARVNAVNDRSKQLAKPKAPDDLFSLPDNNAVADAAPKRRGFWSRPTTNKNISPNTDRPADISAMAPAHRDNTPENRVAPPVQFMPPPNQSRPAKAQGSSYPPFEDVPGVFDSGMPLSMRSGSPPASGNTSTGLFPGGDALGAPPPLTKRDLATKVENRPAPSQRQQSGPVKLDLSGLIGKKSGFDDAPAPVPTTQSMTHERFTPTPEISQRIVVRSIPGDYEPLPEPIPLDQYIASLNHTSALDPLPTTPTYSAVSHPTTTSAIPPLPIGMMAAAQRQKEQQEKKTSTESAATLKIPGMDAIAPLPLPELKTAAKPAAAPKQPATASRAAELKKALEPLPVIATAKAQKETAKPAALPAPVSLPEPLTARDKKEANDTEATAGKDVNNKDFFKTDFWNKPAKQMGSEFDLELPEPRKSERKEPAPLGLTAEIQDLTATAKTTEPVAMPEVAKPEAKKTQAVVEKEKTERPKKIRLQPVRKRGKELNDIDAATDVPPMKF